MSQVDIAAEEPEHLALAQARQSGEDDQATFGAVARKPLNLRPQQEARLPLLVPRRSQIKDRSVDAMPTLLGTPKNLLQELQRDRRLPGCSPPNHPDLILDLRSSNLVNPPTTKLVHRS